VLGFTKTQNLRLTATYRISILVRTTFYTQYIVRFSPSDSFDKILRSLIILNAKSESGLVEEIEFLYGNLLS
jgi:hypothetical protein